MPKKSHKKLLRKGKKSGKKSQRGGANRSNSKQQLSKMKGGRQILKYKVLQSDTALKLQELVIAELQKGWELLRAPYVQAMTKEIYEYKVLQSDTALELEKLVNAELKQGWELLGAAYVQAMTRVKIIYKVKNVEPIDKIEFRKKDISIDNTNIDNYISIGNTNIDNNYVVLDKKDVDEGNIFPGLGIKISIQDSGFNLVHFYTTIKDISYDNDNKKALIKFDEKNFTIKDHQEIQEIKKAHLTIDEFQKITLSEEVTDEIKIGTKINIEYKGQEINDKIIAINSNNKKEIVLNQYYKHD